MLQQHRHRLRRAGGEAQRPAQIHTGGGGAGHAIHILFRQQPVTDLRLRVPQMGRQGPQQQTSVDGAVCVDSIDGVQQLLPRCRIRQGTDLDLYAAQCAAFQCAPQVRAVRFVLAAAQDHQLRRHSLPRQRCRAPFQFFGQGRRRFSARQ